MPGRTKRMYQKELIEFAKSMKRPLENVVATLYPNYTKYQLLDAYKKYYPNEWNTLEMILESYKKKDQVLHKHNKKTRYSPPTPKAWFFSLPKVKYLLSKTSIEKHRLAFDPSMRIAAEEELLAKREKTIKKRETRISLYKKNMQSLDPFFVDALIAAYYNRNSTLSTKMEIVTELQHYDSPKVYEFFQQLNASEKNNQIRKLAFSHLQNCGRYVRLRKNFKGKLKPYSTEHINLYLTPEDLYLRLSNNHSIQTQKKFDAFISHSYQDQEMVRSIVQLLNRKNIYCYCDWMNDDAFLKRSLVSDYTKEVLKIRMEQSNALLYIKTANSDKSEWVNFELQYYRDKHLGRIIPLLSSDSPVENSLALRYNKNTNTINGDPEFDDFFVEEEVYHES